MSTHIAGSDSRADLRPSPSSLGNLLLSPWLYRAMIVSLGLVFVVAGAIKLADPKGFARNVSNYGILPDELLVVVAIGLPLVEVIAGIWLILDLRGGLVSISVLLAVFFAVLGFGVINGLHVDCGCFSTADLQEQNALRNAMVRDLGFVAQAIYIYVWRRLRHHETCYPSWMRRPLFFLKSSRFRPWRASDWTRVIPA